MNYTSLDYVTEVMREHKAMCWRLWDASGDSIDKREDVTLDVEKSITALEKCYNSVEGEYVTIRISSRVLQSGGDQKTNVFQYRLKCKSSGSSDSLPLSPGRGGMDAGIFEMISALRVQVAEQRKDQEISELKRQIQEFKKGKQKNPILDKLITAMLLENSSSPAAQISGDQETTEKAPIAQNFNNLDRTSKEPGDGQKELVNALNLLKSVDSDFVHTLSKLAKFAKDNPEQFNQYKTMLG